MEGLLVVSARGNHFRIDVKGQQSQNFWQYAHKPPNPQLFYAFVYVPPNRLNLEARFQVNGSIVRTASSPCIMHTRVLASRDD